MLFRICGLIRDDFPAAVQLMTDWLAVLRYDRRLSPHTLRAYGDDAERFLDFMAHHTRGSGQR